MAGAGTPRSSRSSAKMFTAGARQRAHLRPDRERQAHGVPRRRVRVLTHDQHPHLAQRVAERPQHGVARRQVATALRDLGAQEVAHRGDLLGHRLQRPGPARLDQVGERSGGHARNLVEDPSGARPVLDALDSGSSRAVQGAAEVAEQAPDRAYHRCPAVREGRHHGHGE